MTESDEEPDYLSDKFLEACLPKDDVRPGLLNRHAEKRKHELLKKQERSNEEHRKKFKSIEQLQEEGRSKGLATAIGQDNKGFQMLQKMGFKPGESIGQNRASPSTSLSLKEPIPIVIKSDKKGLGGKTKLEEKRAKIEEWKEMRNRLSDPEDYRLRVKGQVQERETQADLRKAQSAAKNLDLQNNKDEPSRLWFWPEIPKVEDEEESDEELADEETDEDEPESHEKLKLITEYLRNEYCYCIWCGSSFDDPADLKTSCPGNTRQDH